MTALEDKVENALNETRMLILGAQVLLGFEFQSTFQPVYEPLPSSVQEVKVVSLTLMLLAVGLLIAPGAFHEIVERGDDSPRVTQVTSQIASLALLPFALGIGLDVYVASHVVLSPGAALAAGFGTAAFALVFWYGLEWVWRTRRSVVRTDARRAVAGQFSSRSMMAALAMPPPSQMAVSAY